MWQFVNVLICQFGWRTFSCHCDRSGAISFNRGLLPDTSTCRVPRLNEMFLPLVEVFALRARFSTLVGMTAQSVRRKQTDDC